MAVKLCVIGDSITGGVIYRDDVGRYVKCRDSFVNLLASALGLDVHNHSRFGCTSTAALERLGRYERDIAECDYTLVMLGGNDCDFDWQRVAAAPEAEQRCNTPIGLFRETYGELLDRIAALGGRIIAMNPIPVFGRRYFKWISRTADAEGRDALPRQHGLHRALERDVLHRRHAGGRGAGHTHARRAQRLPLQAGASTPISPPTAYTRARRGTGRSRNTCSRSWRDCWGDRARR